MKIVGAAAFSLLVLGRGMSAARAADLAQECPPGWHSAPGNRCALATCPAHQCQPGEECRQTSVCYMARKQADVARSSGVVEALIVDDPLDVCIGGAVCAPSATCNMAGLCLKPGAVAASAPKNAYPEPTPYVATPRDAPKDEKSGKKGGCGSCAVGASGAGTEAALLACALSLALAIVRRKARRSPALLG